MLRAYGAGPGGQTAEAPLKGAGALCAYAGGLFCAAEGDMLWHLDAGSLQPRALFAGGPDMRDVKLSADGRRLYALLSGADSVLLLDASDGAPLMLARAGCNPPRMALDDAAQALAVAGGRREAVLLLDAHTLAELDEWPAPGPVCDTAFAGDCVFALCRLGRRRSALAVRRSGTSAVFRLPGAPGALLSRAWGVLAATQEGLFACTQTACTRLRRMDGCPVRMAMAHGCLVWIDGFLEAALRLDAAEGTPETMLAPAAGLAAYTIAEEGKA